MVSVEIDPAVAEHARCALTATGYGAVRVITGDGMAGYPAGAPYDRVISTAAATAVPPAWVAQTRPCGRVLTPWGTAFYPGGLLALTVEDDGTSASGGIVGPAAFMWLRAQRIPRYTTSRIVRNRDAAAVSTTDLHPYQVAGDVHAATAIGLRVPRCESFYSPDSSEAGTLYLVDQHSRSWATLHLTPEPPYEVRQSGDRALWEEVDGAYRWWIDAGQPAVEAWRFTVTASGQQVELCSSSGAGLFV